MASFQRTPPFGGAFTRRFTRYSGLYFDEFAADSAWIREDAVVRLPPMTGVDASQQKMMMFMPLMFGYMFYFASAGLVLYWLTGNIVAVVQQWALNRISPPPAPVKVNPNKKGRS